MTELKVWIDKQGGRHYHSCDCPMVKDPMFNYEPIVIKSRGTPNISKGFEVEGKLYTPCPGCLGRKAQEKTKRGGIYDVLSKKCYPYCGFPPGECTKKGDCNTCLTDMVKDASLYWHREVNMKISDDYHDYVFKDGKLLGNFEEMYRHTLVPWHQDELAYMIFSEIALAVLKEGEYGEILDVGCGLGYFTNRLKSELSNTSVTGIDISPTAIQKASRMFPNVNFQAMDILELTLSGSYDLIVCRDIIWYIPAHLPQVIASLGNILSEEGSIYVSQSFPKEADYVGSELVKSPEHLVDILSDLFRVAWQAVEWSSETGCYRSHILLKKEQSVDAGYGAFERLVDTKSNQE